MRSTGAEGNTIEDCSLALPEDQEALLLDVIAAAKENGNKVTVVLNNGGAVTMDKWVNDVDAVLEMWYPGQEGGPQPRGSCWAKSTRAANSRRPL